MRSILLALGTLAFVGPGLCADEAAVGSGHPFDGKPGGGWTWLREDPKAWRIKDGGLEIRVQPGKAATVKNALVRDVPEFGGVGWGFQVTLTNTAEPTQQYEQAGITWYRDGKPVFKLVKELVDGKVVIVPGKTPVAGASVQLKLEVLHDRYTAQYRRVGQEEWKTAATGNLPPGKKDQVSLQCYDGPPDAEHWMRFTDFRTYRFSVLRDLNGGSIRED
jgi:hypothetical protein